MGRPWFSTMLPTSVGRRQQEGGVEENEIVRFHDGIYAFIVRRGIYGLL